MAYFKIATLQIGWLEISPGIVIICYSIVILLIYFGWQKLHGATPGERVLPVTISVIIAARNESENLPVILDDLYNQTYPKELYDIIVVDDHSDQPIIDLEPGKTYPGNNLKVFSLPANKLGKKQALLEGIKHSNAELLLFTDADCRMGQKWIQTYVQHFASDNTECMIGLVNYQYKPGIIQGFFYADLISLVITGAGTAALGFPTLCNGANIAVKRSAYNTYSQKLQLEIPSGDDVFLLHQIKKHNKRAISVMKNKAGIVQTESPENFSEFFNQRIRWASKSIKYSDTATVLLAILVFLTNCIIITTAIFSAFKILHWFVFVILFGLKTTADCLLLAAGLNYFDNKRLVIWVPLYVLVYPFYAFITPILGICNSYSWKGRPGSMRLSLNNSETPVY